MQYCYHYVGLLLSSKLLMMLAVSALSSGVGLSECPWEMARTAVSLLLTPVSTALDGLSGSFRAVWISVEFIVSGKQMTGTSSDPSCQTVCFASMVL